ncbi:MAG TPA: hypothetical protein ENI27_06005, partial [bacterium]|nr:hypothetical protein [bacterium]
SYAIHIPEDWNGGDLVLYAHGYVFSPDITDPLMAALRNLVPPLPSELLTRLGEMLPQPRINEILRNGLLDKGFAVAYSTFSEDGDGYLLKEGVIRTRQLRGIFTSKVGKPAYTYLVGQSLGGAISLMLAEKNPKLFSGALLVSGFVGGGQMQIDYVANAYLLLYHYLTEPGSSVPILPHILDIPEEPGALLALLTDIVPKVITALPGIIPQLLSVRVKAKGDSDEEGIPVFQVDEAWWPSEMDKIVEAILSPLLFVLFGTNEILDRTHGNVMFDNTETVYSDPILDNGVERFTSPPDAANYLKHWYEPTGKLKIPVLTLHNKFDAIVPYYHEDAYYDKVLLDAGNTDMLKQRGVGLAYTYPFGHCKFTLEEIGFALGELEYRVEYGEWPSLWPPLP